MARPCMLLAGPMASLEKRKDFATLRQPVRHEVVTHVSGILDCNLCARNGP
jgi:hypothetical protein